MNFIIILVVLPFEFVHSPDISGCLLKVESNLGSMFIGLKLSSMDFITVRFTLRSVHITLISVHKDLKTDRTIMESIELKFEFDRHRTQIALVL